MESPTVETIKNRLNVIPQNHYSEILQYLDFLTYQDNTRFQLTNRHLEILEESSKTPIEKCIPAKQAIAELKMKYLK